MCPGGVVVNSSSEVETYVTNGMSYQSRSENNANSAILVGINENDFAQFDLNSPFGGVVLQEIIEKAAYTVTSEKGLPVQTVGSFLNKGVKNEISRVLPTVKPSFCECDLNNVLPEYITESIRLALPVFNNQIKGFADDSALSNAHYILKDRAIELKLV